MKQLRLQFNDGYLDLIVIRNCPRWKLVGILLGMKNGQHIKSKYVQYIKVTSLVLPECSNSSVEDRIFFLRDTACVNKHPVSGKYSTLWCIGTVFVETFPSALIVKEIVYGSSQCATSSWFSAPRPPPGSDVFNNSFRAWSVRFTELTQILGFLTHTWITNPRPSALVRIVLHYFSPWLKVLTCVIWSQFSLCPFRVMIQVKAFRLAPGGIVGGRIQGGYIDLDGEVLARGQGAYGDGSNDPMLYGPTIDITVEKGLATIFVPPLS